MSSSHPGLWFRRSSAWIRDQKRLRKKRRRLLKADAIVLSMAKSGRTWLNAMLSHYYHLTEGAPPDQRLNADNFKRLGLRVPSVFFSHGREVEGRAQIEARIRGKPLVFLYRDPRDVVVSWYFQRIQRKRLAGREIYVVDENLPAHPTADVLFEPLWLPYILTFMNEWLERLRHFDRVLFIRYEDMRADPVDALTRVLGIINNRSVSYEAVHRAVQFASFENLRRLERSGHFSGSRLGGGRPGEEGTWKVRRGKIGGFADYFTPAEVARINQYVSAHLDPSFGYADAR